MATGKRHDEPSGRIINMKVDVPIKRPASEDKWEAVYAAFEKLPISQTTGMSVQLENQSDANRCGTAIHGRANLNSHPEYKVRTRTEKLSNGDVLIYLWKAPIEGNKSTA